MSSRDFDYTDVVVPDPSTSQESVSPKSTLQIAKLSPQKLQLTVGVPAERETRSNTSSPEIPERPSTRKPVEKEKPSEKMSSRDFDYTDVVVPDPSTLQESVSLKSTLKIAKLSPQKPQLTVGVPAERETHSNTSSPEIPERPSTRIPVEKEKPSEKMSSRDFDYTDVVVPDPSTLQESVSLKSTLKIAKLSPKSRN